MAKCSQCRADTSLSDNGVPICISCSEGPKRKSYLEDSIMRVLTDGLAAAKKRTEKAAFLFTGVAALVPSRKPDPDGVQRIRSTSHELSAARKEMMRAHTRLNDYLNGGVVPEDLKREA